MPRGQQKVRIPRTDLPEVSRLSDGTYGYIVRYRIISEDQNRFSHWSPIRELTVPPIVPTLDGDIAVNGNIVQVAWGNQEFQTAYDVFISFNGEDYVYNGTTSNNQYSFLAPYDSLSVRALIQVASTEKEETPYLTIFESIETDLV